MNSAGRKYQSKLYHADIAKHLAPILSEPANIDSDKVLMAKLNQQGIPCSLTTVMIVRREMGVPSKYKRIKALQDAAHKMVVNQPIEGI